MVMADLLVEHEASQWSKPITGGLPQYTVSHCIVNYEIFAEEGQCTLQGWNTFVMKKLT